MTAQQSQQEATTSSQCPAVRHAMIYYIIPALLFTISSFWRHKMMSVLIPAVSSPTMVCAKRKKLLHEGRHDFVAIDGDSAVVVGISSVLFYSYKNNKWEYSQTIEMPFEPDIVVRSVAISGNVAVVGDGYVEYDGDGVVYVFERNANTGMWIRASSIVPDDVGPYAFFGDSVDIYDNLMVVGAHRDQRLDGSGSAFVYRRVDDEWRQEMKLLPDDSNIYRFGSSVSIQHNTIAVTGYGNGRSIFVYKYNSSNNKWIQPQEKIVNQDCDNNFGSSLAFTQSGGIMIGCIGENDYTGAIYYYTLSRESERFTRQQKIMASDGQPGNGFGSTKKVAADRNVMAVGAGGKVYIFIMISDNWIEVEIIDDPNEDIFFWRNVALSGNQLLISGYHTIYSYSLEYC